ncbi:hypothetical protein [Lactobacillus sp. ESL0677]|uniref:hypothetical protein n=1 Tax=Lactobacillus sp. ESL0677 TaxID=2983208 RepID=UPI0023F63AD4|nr:hypothetical protein [Lactobacillus sp. ESL0677]WEV36207.1 hypothetical protein OZX76_05525 [Lactobacillus sp. ESL0677]
MSLYLGNKDKKFEKNYIGKQFSVNVRTFPAKEPVAATGIKSSNNGWVPDDGALFIAGSIKLNGTLYFYTVDRTAQHVCWQSKDDIVFINGG